MASLAECVGIQVNLPERKPLFDIPDEAVNTLHRNIHDTMKGEKSKTPMFTIEVLSSTETHEVKRYRYGDLAICDVISLQKPTEADVERAAPCKLGDGVTACIAAHIAVTMGSKQPFYYVHSLYVAETLRGNGVGRKLLAFILNQIGPNWVWLCSQAEDRQYSDSDAQRRLYTFYEDFGFRRLHVGSRLMSLTPNYTSGRKYGEPPVPLTLDPALPPSRHPWDKDARTVAVSAYSSGPAFRCIKETLLKAVDGEDPGVLMCDKVEKLLELPKGTIQLLKAGRINMIVDRIGKADVKTALQELAECSDAKLKEKVEQVGRINSLADVMREKGER